LSIIPVAPNRRPHGSPLCLYEESSLSQANGSALAALRERGFRLAHGLVVDLSAAVREGVELDGRCHFEQMQIVRRKFIVVLASGLSHR